MGNKSASGTEILDEYGEHEIATGDMIVYTSADSVLQTAETRRPSDLTSCTAVGEIAREADDERRSGRWAA